MPDSIMYDVSGDFGMYWAKLDDAEALYRQALIAVGAGGYVIPAVVKSFTYSIIEPDENSADASKGYLRQIRTQLDRLAPDGDLGLALTRNEIEPQRWANVLNENARALVEITRAVGKENYGAHFWNDVVVKSAVEIENGVKEAVNAIPPAVEGNMKWLVVGLVALTILYILRMFR